MANYERHDIRKSPFTVMKNTENDKCKIICGNNLMTEIEFTNLKEAIKYINSKPWELITNLCALMVNNLYQTVTQQQKTDKND